MIKLSYIKSCESEDGILRTYKQQELVVTSHQVIRPKTIMCVSGNHLKAIR